MTDTIAITNVEYLTYPKGFPDNHDLAVKLTTITDEDRSQIAATLAASVPDGKISFKVPMPDWLRLLHDSRNPIRYFGHVRYLEAYSAVFDEYVGRMDVGYGDAQETEDFIASVI